MPLAINDARAASLKTLGVVLKNRQSVRASWYYGAASILATLEKALIPSHHHSTVQCKMRNYK